jgi:hypothetical protein
MYRSGTATHVLHRGHFAVTGPSGGAIRKIALRITTSAALRTTRTVRQIGHGLRSPSISTFGKVHIVDR